MTGDWRYSRLRFQPPALIKMMCSEPCSLDFITSQNGPYNSSIASSASSSSASVWSETSSQSSDDTSVSVCAPSDLLEQCDSYISSRRLPPSQCNQITSSACWSAQAQQSEVPQELRQNPRRTNSSTTTRTGCPPSLVRQSDRKVNFVDSLVGKQ